MQGRPQFDSWVRKIYWRRELPSAQTHLLNQEGCQGWGQKLRDSGPQGQEGCWTAPRMKKSCCSKRSPGSPSTGMRTSPRVYN